jgi:beta-lactamase class A
MRKSVIILALVLSACGGSDRRESQVRHDEGPQPVVQVVTRGPVELQAELDRLSRVISGRVAITVRDVPEGWTVRAGDMRPMPQQSVSKLWVAMTILDQVDRGVVRPSDPVVLIPSDTTLFHQPVAALIGGVGYRTTVSDLMERALTQSDNTANDRLLTLAGGPTAVNGMLRAKHLDGISFGPGERALQSGTAGLVWHPSYVRGGFERARAALPPGARARAYSAYVTAPPDGATSDGVTAALTRLQQGELLSASSSARMLATMSRTRTGRARLKAGLPAGWRLAHKTGTGQNYNGRTAGYNDVGIAYAPDGHAYAIAVLIGDTGAPERSRQSLIASVARAVAAAHGARHP